MGGRLLFILQFKSDNTNNNNRSNNILIEFPLLPVQLRRSVHPLASRGIWGMHVTVVSGLEQPSQQTSAWVSAATMTRLLKKQCATFFCKRPFALVTLTATPPKDDSSEQPWPAANLLVRLRTKAGLNNDEILLTDGSISAAGLSSLLSRAWLSRLLSTTPQIHAASVSFVLPSVSAELRVLATGPQQRPDTTQYNMSAPVPLLLAAPADTSATLPLAPAPATHARLHQLPTASGDGKPPPPEHVSQALALFFTKPQVLLTGQLLTLPMPAAAHPPPSPPWAADKEALLLPPPDIFAAGAAQAVACVRFRVGVMHCAEGLQVHTWLGAGGSTAGAQGQAAATPGGVPATEAIQDAVCVSAAFVGASFTELTLTSGPPSPPSHTHPLWAAAATSPSRCPPAPKAALLTCVPGVLQSLTHRLAAQQHVAVCAPHHSGKRVLVAAAAAAAALPCLEVHAADVLRSAQGGARSSKAIMSRVAEALGALQTAALGRMGPCVLHLRCAHLLLLAAAAEHQTLTQRLGQGELLGQTATAEPMADAGTPQSGAAAAVVRGWLGKAAAIAFSTLQLQQRRRPATSSSPDSGKHVTTNAADDWAYFSRESMAASVEAAASAAGPVQASVEAAASAAGPAPAAMVTWVLSAAHPAVFEHLPCHMLPPLQLHDGGAAAAISPRGVRCVLHMWQCRVSGGSQAEAPLSTSDERKLCALTPAQLDDCCVSAWDAVAAHAEHAGPRTAVWLRCLLQRATELTPLPLALQQKAVDESEHSQFAMLPGWLTAAPGILGDNAAAVQRTSWADVGGADEAKAELHRLVTLPLAVAQRATHQGTAWRPVLRMSGILMFGPPGTGKTLLAKAVAHECGVAFHSVKGPELLDKYIGESEGNVRRVFEGARAAAPCVIFFDELDALAPARGSGADSGGVSDRVVSALLAEMDACSKHPQPVFVLGATNRPDLLDSALLRPGRFDRRVYVGPLQTAAAQVQVLQAQLAHMQVHADVTAEAVQLMLPEVCTGADIRGLLSQASTAALRRRAQQLEDALRVSCGSGDSAHPSNKQAWEFAKSLPAEQAKPLASLSDFRAAAAGLSCSVSPEDLARYEALRDRLASSRRAHAAASDE